jgi:hypothetical protein
LTIEADSQRRVLIQKLSWARAEIVRVAAAWQAAGHDTAALSEPLVQIQEALSLLEAQARPERSAGGGREGAKRQWRKAGRE